jgi:chitinase
MVDVKAFAEVIDWVLLMNYDVWGSSPKPGPNAPLTDSCHNSTQPLANAQAAIKSWNEAGFPLDQITLGVPAYGYISKSSVTRLSQRSMKLDSPDPNKGDSDSGKGQGHIPRTNQVSRIIRPPMFKSHHNDNSSREHASERRINSRITGSPNFNARTRVNSSSQKMRRGSVTLQNESGGSGDGQIQFRDMVKQGALKVQDGNWVGANGFQRFWDDCSSTPFLRSEAAEQVISYDDPKSMEMKGRLAKEAGILGVNMWDAHGDTEDWQLIDAVRKGLGV